MASFKWLNACSAFLYFPVGLPKHVLFEDKKQQQQKDYISVEVFSTTALIGDTINQ